MTKIEERIEAAWQKSRGEKEYTPGYPVKASSNFVVGYKAGTADALCSQWVCVEEALPKDDNDVLAISICGKSRKTGLARCWRNNNGSFKWYSEDINTDYIRFWMPIPKLPER